MRVDGGEIEISNNWEEKVKRFIIDEILYSRDKKTPSEYFFFSLRIPTGR